MKKCPHGFCGNLADVCELCRMEKEITQLRAQVQQQSRTIETLQMINDSYTTENKQQAEALRVAKTALESCVDGDYSTGSVIHPSFDADAVNNALAAIDALPTVPKGETK